MQVKRKSGAGEKVLENILSGLSGDSQCKVGFTEQAKYPDGTPVAYVAVIQEFGDGKSIPPRPFMRPTVARDNPKWRELAEKGARSIARGNDTIETVLDKLGGVAAGGVKRSIQEVTSPALSPVTLVLRKWRREGRKITGATVGQAAAYANSPGADFSGAPTKPLVDEGIMFGAVTHAVESGQ